MDTCIDLLKSTDSLASMLSTSDLSLSTQILDITSDLYADQHQRSKSDKAMVSVKSIKQLKSFLQRSKTKEDNSESLGLGAFHRFTELPREIRNIIYYYALPDHPRIVTLCTDGCTNARWLESLSAKARLIMRRHRVIKPQMSLVIFAVAHDFLKVREWRSDIPLALHSVSFEAREESRKGFDFVSIDGIHNVPMRTREDTLLLGSRSEYYVNRIPNSTTVSLEGGCLRNVVDLLDFIRRTKQAKGTKQGNALYQVRQLMVTHGQWLFFCGTWKQHLERFLLHFEKLETLKVLTMKPYIHYPKQQPMGLLPLGRSHGRSIRRLCNRDLNDIQSRNPQWQRPRLELWVQWPIYRQIGDGPERELLWAEPTLFTDDLAGV